MVINPSHTNGSKPRNGVLTNGTHTNGNTTNGTSHVNGVARKENYGFSTRAIHVGSLPDPTTGAVIPPISLSTTYEQSAVGEHKGFEYSRSGNPNRNALETLLASLEAGGAEGLAFASGSAATAAVVGSLHLQEDGKGSYVTGLGRKRPKILCVNDVYGGTWRYLHRVSGCDVRMMDFSEYRLTSKDLDGLDMIWIETPTNPTLRVVDVQHVVNSLSGPQRPLVVVDNTFLSPFYQSPLLLGADIVVHSLTKYINGHSDVVGGAVILPARHSAALLPRIRFLQNAGGAVPSPFDAFLLTRSAKTLALRMKAHGVNALALARALKSHDLVESIQYPGLAEHPSFETVKRSLAPHAKRFVDTLDEEEEGGIPYGGMITLTIKSTSPEQAFRRAERLLTSLKLFTLAESLGGVESLAEHPARMTHSSVPEEEREALGITEGMVRLSVGIEDGDDLLRDVLSALDIVRDVE